MIKRYNMRTAEIATPAAPPLDEEPTAIQAAVTDELDREDVEPSVDVGEMAQVLDENKEATPAETSESVKLAGYVINYDKHAMQMRVKPYEQGDITDHDERTWSVFLPNANAAHDPNAPAGVYVAVIEVRADQARPDKQPAVVEDGPDLLEKPETSEVVSEEVVDAD
jgi:hypothetical protein